MILKMIKTTYGAEDGINVLTYEKGKEYEINTDLARVFIDMKVAEKVADFKSAAPPSNKAVKPKEDKEVKKEDVKKEVKEDKKKDKKDK